ncbi:MAG: helix-turn-helix transcriptional regulator [Candidatus Aenigmarchaeota archaeon]|nr:helix-turn-helix transcriptional regulator [Candidatus Aenigmarchaeota archaeon]
MSKNDSAFVKVLGETPYIKVLDFLLAEGRVLDYSLTDIAKHTGVAWSTLHSVWPELVKLGIVTKTRTVGRSNLYRLNEENPLVQILIKSDFLLSKFMVDIKRGKASFDSYVIDNEFKKLHEAVKGDVAWTLHPKVRNKL